MVRIKKKEAVAMRKFVLAEALLLCLVVGTAGGGYWGEHYSSVAALN
jgi:hypothetical protein